MRCFKEMLEAGFFSFIERPIEAPIETRYQPAHGAPRVWLEGSQTF